jgi:hypothetical protein
MLTLYISVVHSKSIIRTRNSHAAHFLSQDIQYTKYVHIYKIFVCVTNFQYLETEWLIVYTVYIK